MISPRMSCSVKFFDPTTIRFSREGPQEQSSSVRTLIMKDVIGAVFILSMRRQSANLCGDYRNKISSQFPVLGSQWALKRFSSQPRLTSANNARIAEIGRAHV